MLGEAARILSITIDIFGECPTQLQVDKVLEVEDVLVRVREVLAEYLKRGRGQADVDHH